MKLKEIIKVLEASNYNCIAGDLKNNIAFVKLKNMSESNKAMCCLGKDHPCPLNVNDGYCCAIECQYKVIEK
ncbi:MAG: hypothetical protein H8D45_29110 [Bacteroidetes bacterium]|nr:hypothetical protein [Bacteroidota bacterium]